MAIVSLIALLAALGVAALAILQPWSDSSVAPEVSIAPGPGVGLDDAVEVSPGRELAVAPARPAGGGDATLAAEARGGGDAARAQPAVAPARPVAAPRPAGSPEATPVLSPSEPPPQAAPKAVPVVVTVPPPAPVPQQPPASPSRPMTGGPTPGGSTSGMDTVGGRAGEAIEIRAGDEHAFSFTFQVQPTVYKSPGEENLIFRFRDPVGELPRFGLQLWDDGSGSRGLWAAGEAAGGDRFLAPVAEGVWHEATIHFSASGEGEGFYLLLLDGAPIDARAWVSLVDAETGSAEIEAGLSRDGEAVVVSPDISFGPTELGETLESVIP